MTLGQWQLLLVLLIVALPALAVGTEKTEKVLSRRKFLLWLVGVLAYPPVVMPFTEKAAGWAGAGTGYPLIIFFSGSCSFCSCITGR